MGGGAARGRRRWRRKQHARSGWRRSTLEAAVAALPARGGVAGMGGSRAGCGRGAPHGAASMRAVGREGWEREEVRV